MNYLLFSYGTLQYEKVQIANFGRKLNGKKSAITGFKIAQLSITDASVVSTSGAQTHPIAIYTANPLDSVEGMVFEITEEELIKADSYEVADYKRVAVHLEENESEHKISVWVYIDVNANYPK